MVLKKGIIKDVKFGHILEVSEGFGQENVQEKFQTEGRTTAQFLFLENLRIIELNEESQKEWQVLKASCAAGSTSAFVMREIGSHGRTVKSGGT